MLLTAQWCLCNNSVTPQYERWYDQQNTHRVNSWSSNVWHDLNYCVSCPCLLLGIVDISGEVQRIVDHSTKVLWTLLRILRLWPRSAEWQLLTSTASVLWWANFCLTIAIQVTTMTMEHRQLRSWRSLLHYVVSCTRFLWKFRRDSGITKHLKCALLSVALGISICFTSCSSLLAFDLSRIMRLLAVKQVVRNVLSQWTRRVCSA